MSSAAPTPAGPLMAAEDRRARLEELAAWGVDLSLSWAQLGKSPAQRLDEWVAMHAFAEAAAGARARGQVRRVQKKPGRAEEC